MRNVFKNAIILILALITITLCVVFSIRTSEQVASTRTPDAVHKHQIFSHYPLTEEFTATSRGLSAIGVYAQSSNPETIVHIALRDLVHNRVISEQDVQAKNLNSIHFSRQAMSVGKRYSITISAEHLTKAQAVKISYQSDATLDPTSIVTQASEKKQGSLGLIEYERPTIALQLVRWLILPHQRGLWAGVVVCIIGFTLWRSPLYKVEKLREVIFSPHMRRDGVRPYAYIAVIIFSALIIYWPATHLFFYSDDVPILTRVAMLWNHNPLLLFTPHRYADPDAQSQFGFDFYRPISFSLYPLMLHLLFPPNAAVYYFLNILIFSGIACVLFLIALRILKSRQASLLIVFLWMAHSSKLGLVYWWSSVQDLLASFFAILSIVLYFKWKDTGSKKILYLSIFSFTISLFSKEYVIVLPIAIAGIELLSGFSKTRLLSIVKNILPYIITAGAFLIVNTAILGDPTLPAHKETDQTYALSINPVNIIRNIVVYTSFTAEQRLWPENGYTKPIELFLSNNLELWRLKTTGPYYPSVIILIFAILSSIIFWKNSRTRNILLLSYAWWILFIGPFLLFTSDWRSRWLTLALFGSSMAIVIILQKIIPKKWNILWYALCIAVLIYGFNTARNPELTRFAREQSAYTHEAYNQLKQQEKNISIENQIILIGIAQDQKTSLNAYLFRLYAKNPNSNIMYADSLESLAREAGRRSGDVIINMINIIPYYPESEK